MDHNHLTSKYRVAKAHKMPYNLQVIFRKRATNYRAYLRKMTYKDKASYRSSPPCITRFDVEDLSYYDFMIFRHEIDSGSISTYHRFDIPISCLTHWVDNWMWNRAYWVDIWMWRILGCHIYISQIWHPNILFDTLSGYLNVK